MFIIECQKAVKNTKMTQTKMKENIKPLYEWIGKLEQWLNEVPPIDQPMRFGNKAFKTWVDKIRASIDTDLAEIMQVGNPEFKHKERAIVEIREYLLESFGSYERIDYGTGHELNFYVFLYCMCKIGIYTVDDYEVLINKVFNRYLQLMRRLQTYYYLEPAGSHGVWGLDDYQMLAFLFGASQLCENPEGFTPECIHNE